ncbi:hypothetical protein HPB52_025359 [Rhipicephalus sanguineus]|uniref:Uncharacterized protein n=1 Tax=Rhipicephalus sanguineus TaxID=34632 RepID=A0A9D4YRH6_RHISA|nr:hypothetical protein HPB52_025359 [Rhipicephalus sanguineus]
MQAVASEVPLVQAFDEHVYRARLHCTIASRKLSNSAPAPLPTPRYATGGERVSKYVAFAGDVITCPDPRLPAFASGNLAGSTLLLHERGSARFRNNGQYEAMGTTTLPLSLRDLITMQLP